jgi:hypothetical protein
VLVGKPEGKRPLGKRKLGWERNIKIDIKYTENENLHWINLAQGGKKWRAVVNTVMNLQIS